MAPDGPTAPKSSRWPWMAPDGSRWPRIAPDGSRLPRMAPNSAICFQNAWKAIYFFPGWLRMPPQRVPDGLRWHQMWGPRCPQMAPHCRRWLCQRWLQMASDASKMRGRQYVLFKIGFLFFVQWGRSFAKCGVGIAPDRTNISRPPRYLQMAPDDFVWPQMTTRSYYPGKVFYQRGRSF